MPEVFELSKDNFYVDYAYHLAPMDKKHISEIPELIDEFGVTSFKIFMFYGASGGVANKNVSSFGKTDTHLHSIVILFVFQERLIRKKQCLKMSTIKLVSCIWFFVATSHVFTNPESTNSELSICYFFVKPKGIQ